MKKNKIIIPKNTFRLSFQTKFFVYSISIILISLLFITFTILEGIYFDIKKNITQNYNSHLSVSAVNYSPHTAQDLSSWWITPSANLENPQNQTSLRAITKRSVMSAVYQTSTQQFPIQLTLLDNNDSGIFNNFMSPTTTGTLIRKNSIHIGKKLAQRLNLKDGDTFPMYIPSLNYTATNIKVSYIYNSPDHFNDNYGVYLNRQTFQESLDSKFQKYHIRFYASPFISLLESDITPIISENPKKYADDLLNYQYLQLNTIKKNITKWSYFFYFLCGILLFLSMHHRYSLIVKDVNSYTYKIGFIPTLQPHFKILLKVFFQLITISISACIVLFIFIKIDPYISSMLFLQDNPIFPELNLPLTYQFDPKIPDIIFLNIIPIGTLIGMISFGLMMFIYSILPNFSDSQNKPSYIAIGFIIVAILGFTSANGYLYNSFADQTRQKYWTQYFFGKYSLYEKNYLHYNALRVSPQDFIIPSDLLIMLQENPIQYMTTLEVFGTASIHSSSNIEEDEFVEKKMKKNVSIKALQGNLMQFSNILLPLLSNQIVIGKDVADYFLSNKILNLSFEKDFYFNKNINTSSNMSLDNTNTDTITDTFNITNNLVNASSDMSLDNTNTNITNQIFIVAHIVDLPVGDFNNTIFINQTNLAEILKIKPNSITKLQSSGLKKVLSRYTNNDIILTPIQQNILQWKQLTNLVMTSYFISVLLQTFISAMLILSVILYLNTIDKNLLINYYIWGIPYDPLKKYSLIAMASFIVGIFVAWLSKLLLVIRPNSIPEFLQILRFTPKQLAFSIDWGSTFLISIGSIFIFTIVYFIFNKILKNNTKNMIKYLFKDQHS
ncbi:MAG: hypothetical protein KFW21_00050 [Spirochaetota bacterium]|nr:hypothetical protein [Spirochaetota bacterium]